MTGWRRNNHARVLGGLCLLLTGFLLTAQAYETDQFTQRLKPLADAMPALDARVNASIRDAIADWRGSRNDWRVVNRIYRDLGGRHWVDRIERWAMRSPAVERLREERHDSIYSGHPFWATRVAALFGIGPTIQVNQVLIGSDKLGHFFSQGRKFYRRYLRYGDEARAAEHSAFTERAIFGQLTTGIYSNADLVANYEGYRFYRSLFDADVIPGKAAILRWQNGGYRVQRNFSFADHVNAYWDEALNINDYDRLLRPRIRERLLRFCGDYHAAPWLYTIQDEDSLRRRYASLQLRDSSELRLDQLCKSNDQPAATDSREITHHDHLEGAGSPLQSRRPKP